MTTSGRTNDKEWQRVVQWMKKSYTTSDNEWKRMTKSGTKNENKWKRIKVSKRAWLVSEWNNICNV